MVMVGLWVWFSVKYIHGIDMVRREDGVGVVYYDTTL